MIYISEANVKIYFYVGLGVIALFSILFIIIMLSRKKGLSIPVDQTFLATLYQALGTKDNIKAIDMKQQRLQIEVASVKAIDQGLLKQTNTPAFVTGKKITLLIKHNEKEVFNYLNEKRKEEI